MIPFSSSPVRSLGVVAQKVQQNDTSTLLEGKVLLDNRPCELTKGALSFRFRSPFGSLILRVCEPSSSSKANPLKANLPT
jgi:hypothetical protein